MWPGHRLNLRLILVPIGLPQERVRGLRSPLSRRLPALDLEVQVRPAAAGPFFAEQTHAISFLNHSSGDDSRVDLKEVAVAVIPAPVIAKIDDVIALSDRRIGII